MTSETTTPETEYAARLGRAETLLNRYTALDEKIANWRLWVFVAGVLVGLVGVFTRLFSPAWTFVFVVGFIALVIWQRPAYTRRKLYERIARFYRQGRLRVRGGWQGQGIPGGRYANVDHPYADDLDLFGPGSLFELLCTARTRSGEETLASWLLGPADRETILARQEAIRELSPKLDSREQTALLGEDIRSSINPDSLAAWAGAPVRLAHPMARVAAILAAAGTLAGAVYWAAVGPSLPFYLFLAAGQIVTLWMGAPGQKAVRAWRIGRDLSLLAELLTAIEKTEFQSPRLKALREQLAIGGAPASRRIADLQRLVDFLSAMDNQFFRPIGAILLWKPQFSFAIEAWRAKNGVQIARWLAVVGEFEALSALAGYSYEHPKNVFPEIAEREIVFRAEGIAHPLLPEGGAIANDLSIGERLRLMIVSGSNMSGKSTLLRTIGVNAVLALAGAPVRARSLRLSGFHIGTSIRTTDSLAGGVSRFYAEITRIHQVVDIAKEKPPALFLLDEILHGTNSHDRRIGAEGIVRSLIRAGAIGLITTHDLALANLAEDRELNAENVHFEDHMEEGRMVFDYTLRPGLVTKSNAIALMRAVGLDV